MVQKDRSNHASYVKTLAAFGVFYIILLLVDLATGIIMIVFGAAYIVGGLVGLGGFSNAINAAVNINTSILGDSSISLAASTNLYDPNTATSLAVAFSDPGNSAYSVLGVIGIVVGAALIFVAFIMFIIQI